MRKQLDVLYVDGKYQILGRTKMSNNNKGIVASPVKYSEHHLAISSEVTKQL